MTNPLDSVSVPTSRTSPARDRALDGVWWMGVSALALLPVREFADRQWPDLAPQVGLDALLLHLSMVAMLVVVPMRRLPARALGLSIAIFLALGAQLHYGVIDDAYITLRHAENLARGAGPVFNPGERVEGSTSFLWVLLLGTLHRISGVRLETLAFGAGILAGILTLALSVRACRATPGMVLVAASYVPLAFWGFSGMETVASLGLSLGLALGARRIADRPAPRGALGLGLVAGVAYWARPDAALFAVAIGVWLLVRGRRIERWRIGAAYAGGVALLVVPLTLFRIVYYGDLVPNPYFVKVDGSGPALWARGAAYLGRHLPPMIPLTVAGAAGAWLTRRSTATQLALLWCAAQLAIVLWTGGDHFEEARGSLPFMVALTWLAANGASALMERGTLRPRPAGRLAPLLAALLAIVTLQGSFRHRELGARSSLLFGRVITEQWAHAGRWLREHADRDDLVATPVAGALPYFSGLRALDLYGLNDRTIGRRRVRLGEGRPDHEKYDSEYALAREPDYIYLGAFETSDWAEARAKTRRMEALADLLARVSPSDYQILTGRHGGVPFTFLHRSDRGER